MADLQGLAFFDGINQVIDASYTLAHGISPGSCQITMAPQEETFQEESDLVFTFDETSITLIDCKADLATSRRNDSGLIWQVSILDRRWKWRFGTISGEYNRLDASGELIEGQNNGLPSSEKAPQELAQLLFEAMDEEDYDLSALPNDSRPYVLWDDDNPAEALANLCEQLGCHIVLNLDDSVSIVVIGEGADLPDDPLVMENSLSVDSPETPDEIEVVGGPTLTQQRLTLQAMGRETDGTWKPIDQLSYKPSTGWDAETNLFSGVTDDASRKQALATVFKSYQILLDSGDNSSPAWSEDLTVTDLAQILPIRSVLVQTYLDDKIEKPLPSVVYGVFWIGNTGTPLNSNQTRIVSGGVTVDQENPGDNFQFKGEFSVDEEKGIVNFNQPLRVWDSGSELFRRCTQLYLDCSYQTRYPDTWEFERYSYDYSVPGASYGTGPEIVKKADELQVKIYTSYDAQGGSAEYAPLVQESDLDPMALAYAQFAAKKYQTPSAADATYAGLRSDINLDGAIMQITWTVGPGGATTRVSRNSETHPYEPQHKTKRWYDKLTGMAKGLAPLLAEARKMKTNKPTTRNVPVK